MKRLIIINLILLIALNILPKEVKVEAKEEIKTEVIQEITSRSLEEPRQDHIVANNKMMVESDKCQSKPTEISQEGIDLIKQFEGLRLQAYRLSGEKYWTIRLWNA